MEKSKSVPLKLVKPVKEPKAPKEPKASKEPKAPKEIPSPPVKASKESKAPKPQVIIQQVKAKRPASKYNLFISEQTKGGKMNFSDAVKLYNDQKTKST